MVSPTLRLPRCLDNHATIAMNNGTNSSKQRWNIYNQRILGVLLLLLHVLCPTLRNFACYGHDEFLIPKLSHILGNKSHFSKLARTYIIPLVMLEDRTKSPITRMGTTKNLPLDSTLYVPKFPLNLLYVCIIVQSLSQLIRNFT